MEPDAKKHDSPLINPHEFRHKRLEMKDDFRTHSNAMFVKRSPFDNFRFQSIIEFGEEFEGEGL